MTINLTPCDKCSDQFYGPLGLCHYYDNRYCLNCYNELLAKRLDKFKFQPRQYVKIQRRHHGHFFSIGETVMISSCWGDPERNCCDVYSHGWQNNGSYSVFNKDGCCMNVADCEIEKSTREAFHNPESGLISSTHYQSLQRFKAKDPTKLINWEYR